MKTIITSDRIARPVGPYSAGVRSRAAIFFSGQVAQDPATGKLIEGDAAAQTERIFTNISALLGDAGKTLDDVVKTTVYLANMSDYQAMNAVYGKHFSAPYPARTTIAVVALPLGAAVEIEVIVE